MKYFLSKAYEGGSRVITNGSGGKFLADDGTYKTIDVSGSGLTTEQVEVINHVLSDYNNGKIMSDENFTTTFKNKLDSLNGERDLEMKVNTTHLQWRYVGDTVWNNLISLDELRGFTVNIGETGQVLTKKSNTSGDWEFRQLTNADVGLGNVQNVDTTNIDNINESSTKKIMTDTERTKLSDAFIKSTDTTDLLMEGLTKLLLTTAERDKLNNLSGVNTGDQDLSGLVQKTTTINGNPLSSNVEIPLIDTIVSEGTGTSILRTKDGKTQNIKGISGDDSITIVDDVANKNIQVEVNEAGLLYDNIPDGTLYKKVTVSKLSEITHTNRTALDSVSGINTGDETKATIEAKLIGNITSHTHSYEPTITAGATSQYYRGDKTFQTLDKTAVGLSNVTNDAQIKKITSSTNDNIVTFGATTGDVVKDSGKSVNNVAFKNEINTFTKDVSIDGTLQVSGNIVQNGASYETHAEQVYTKDNTIILRDGAVSGLGAGEYAGFTAKLYDGTNDGQLVFDKDGIARVGDIGNTQAVATREETPSNGNVAIWDSASSKFITNTGNTGTGSIVRANSPTFTGTVNGITPTMVGLGNVKNLDTSNPANITWTASYRTVTDTEKATWNGKQNALGYTAENSANKKTAWQATPDNTSYPSEKLVKDSLNLKVDKVTGKQLSTEDYTTAEKTKLSGIETGANNYTHPTGDGNSHIPATGTTNNGKILKAGATANSANWGNVDWNEVTNKPTSMPASDVYAWAKAATKPTYTFAEIGSRPTTIAGYGITDGAIQGTAYSNLENNVKIVQGVPAGGKMYLGEGAQTGAIKIKLPKEKSRAMFKFRVKMNEYSTGGKQSNAEYIVKGYNLAQGFGYNPEIIATQQVTVVKDNSSLMTPVFYFCTGATEDYILIGEITDTHNYKTVVIDNVEIHHQGIIDDWARGWAISLVTTLETLTSQYKLAVTPSLNATHLNGVQEDATATANTIVKRDGSGDVAVRLVRQEYADQATISGGLVFRTAGGSGTDNYLRVCNNVANIRTFLGVPSTAIATTSANGLMSSTDKTKLDGITAGANNYTHPTGDGYSHIPATSTTNNGKVLKAGTTANSASWGNVDWSEIANKPTTFTPTAHNHAISEVTNLQTSLDAKVSTSDVVTTATANKILKLDANAKLPANITGNADGNAATATKLLTARMINGVSFDGSENISIQKINTRGQVACETGADRPALGGVSTQSCYANGYPTPYGEVLTLNAGGSAQLLLGWAGGNGTAPAYIRSKRDVSDSLWSDWHMIYTTAYKPSLADLGAASSSHAHAFSEITSKPTTLSGYGITDGVTLTGTETLTNKTLTSPVLNGVATGTATTTTGEANKLVKVDSNGNLSLSSANLDLTNSYIRIRDTQTTPQQWWIGSGVIPNDGKFFIHNVNKSIQALIFNPVNNQMTISSLAGTGNRIVVADANGNLSASGVITKPITQQAFNYTAIYGINYVNSGTGGQNITLPLALSGVEVVIISKTQGVNTFLTMSGTNRIYDINGNDVTASYTVASGLSNVKKIKLIGTQQKDRAGGLLNSGTVDWVITELDGVVQSHTHAFADLTSKPTTLSGYGITDAVSTSQVSASNAASKVVQRDGAGDVTVRLIRAEYQNQSDISGGLVFRTASGSGTDNYLRVCNNVSAIRTFLGTPSTAVATTSVDGLMSSTDKTKLDGLSNYTHPASGVAAGTYKSVTVDAQGHITSGSNPTTLSGYGITDAPTKTGSGASGEWGISVTGGSKYIYFDDSDRNPNNILPNAHTRFVSFSFAQSSHLGTGGTYGGVMTFNPWSGTTASTGDASYQLAFGSSQANAGGIPRLRLRKGIDTTWENWYEIYHSGNKQPVNWSEISSKPTTLSGYGITDAASSGHTHNSLNGIYVSGGQEKPNYFGGATLKCQMLFGSNVGGGGDWKDVIWVSGYGGGDVKLSNALVFGKGSPSIGFVQQNFDSTSWGTYNRIYHSGDKPSWNEILDTPTSMPASDVYSWAKQSAKPSYTASEVGAMPLSGGEFTGGVTTFAAAGNIGVGDSISGLQVIGAGTTGAYDAYMTFHKPGVFAVKFGLGPDNQLEVGGWSLGNNRYKLWTAQNFDPNSKLNTGDISAWAKASTKPSYTYSEVGAVPQRTRTNWHSDDASLDAVVGQLAWKNYGNSHTIFDASAGTSPDGTIINNANPTFSWKSSFPTLMGWNGGNTYGVRVDSARNADSLNGLPLNTSGRNNVANEIVRTDGNGYIQAGWINTTSGDSGTDAISRIYASNDGYIRYYTPANFISALNLVKGNDTRLSDARTPLSHVHSVATQSTAGFMSAADKTKLDEINGASKGVIFSQTGGLGVTNTTTETSLIGAGAGSKTIPANSLQVGSIIRVKISGAISTASVISSQSTIRFKFGSTVLLTHTATPPSNLTSCAFDIEFTLLIITTGATGTAKVIGNSRIMQTSSGSIVLSRVLNNLSPITINTTVSSSIDCTYQWAAAGPSPVNSILSHFASIERLY